MNKFSRLFLPVVFVAVGVVAGMNLQHPVAAQDNARQKDLAPVAGPTRWDYRILIWNFNVDAPEKVEQQLHKLGEEGYDIDTSSSTPSSIVYTLRRKK